MAEDRADLEATRQVGRRGARGSSAPAAVTITPFAPPPQKAQAADETIAPAVYRPRPAPSRPVTPTAPPVVANAGDAPARAVTARRRSAVRASRRRSILTLGLIGFSCVVTTVGLVLLGFVVWG